MAAGALNNKEEFHYRMNYVKSGSFKVFIFLILALWAMTTIFPLLWVFVNAFKPGREVLSDSFALPAQPTLVNFWTAFGKLNMAKAFGISMLISGSVVITVLLLGGLAAYAMTRYNFRLKSAIFALLVGCLLIPAFSTIIPVFTMMLKLKLVNNPLSVIIVQTANNMPFAIIVLMGYMSSIPLDLEEAAFLEGCSLIQIYYKIIVPTTRSAFATVGIFTFLWSYNDLFLQMVLIRTRNMYPLSALLNLISSPQYGTDYGLMAASVTLVVLPVLVVYLFLSNNIIKGLTAGAIKG